MEQQETNGRTEVFACAGPATIAVQLRSGSVELRTIDSDEIRVHLGAGDDEGRDGLIDQTTVSFSEDARRLTVRAPRGPRRGALAVVVEAPEGSRLFARLHRGPVTAKGRLAGLNAGTSSGDIEAEHVEGDVLAATGSGDIRLGRVQGRLRARSGSGEIQVASLDGERARLTTGRGDVWVGVVRSDVHARTGHGSVVLAEVAGGRLDLVTGSGDVNVALRPGVTAEIDLGSGSGEVRSDLEVLARAPAGAAAARIRARTGRGDAVVARALA